MNPTNQSAATDAILDATERQRRWFRRAFWAGVTFIVAAFLFAIGNPLFVHLQLQQHGWTMARMQSVGAPPSWLPGWAEPWVRRFDAAFLLKSPVRVDDVERFQSYPNLRLLALESTDLSERGLQTLSQLSQIEMLQFESVQFEGNGVRHLAALPNLGQIAFFRMTLGEAALEGLGTCNQIKTLTLSSVKLREEDLRHLSRNGGLQWLELHQCDVTDRGLEHVAQCQNLQTLDLRATLITDDGLASLARLRHLKSLTLQMGKFTDAGAKQIAASCAGLKYLNLHNEPITDAALHELTRLPQLEQLNLSNIPITDDGVRYLKSCSRLKTLNIKNTKVGGSGVEDLRKTLPTLEVSIK